MDRKEAKSNIEYVMTVLSLMSKDFEMLLETMDSLTDEQIESESDRIQEKYLYDDKVGIMLW